MTRAALVTGAAGGIGAAIVARLEADGWSVHGVDVADADLATREGNRAVVEAALERFGRLDAVVANAGLQHVSSVRDFPEDRWEMLLAVLLTSPFLLAKYAWDALAESGDGRFCAVSSAHGLVASPFKAGYVSAKHALEGLSKVAAIEGAAHGVTSNCVSPGYVRTPLVDKQIADQAASHGIGEDEVVEHVMLARTPIKRLIDAADVAGAVCWLAGPHAGNVTGTTLTLDGGWTAN
jgi:3-hydroxybutyrate dehydrogenase